MTWEEQKRKLEPWHQFRVELLGPNTRAFDSRGRKGPLSGWVEPNHKSRRKPVLCPEMGTWPSDIRVERGKGERNTYLK